MRTIIAGSRTILNKMATFSAIAECGWRPSAVLSGTATGPDKHGELWAEQNGVPLERYPADWDTLGKRAGLVRNTTMAAQAQALIAVWDGVSTGTKHMIDHATERGLWVFVKQIEIVSEHDFPPATLPYETKSAAKTSPARIAITAALERAKAARDVPKPPELGTICSVCYQPQFQTSSGLTCPSGHGGAMGLQVIAAPPPPPPSVVPAPAAPIDFSLLANVPRPPVDLAALRYGDQVPAGLGMSTVLADMDFETYSEAGYVWNETANNWDAMPGAAQNKKGLPIVGAAAYAEHPSTEVLTFAYDLKDGRGARRWRPGQPDPTDLFSHIMQGRLVEAWNSSFEQHIWNTVATAKYGWPPLPVDLLRCAMGKARAHALPGSLDLAATVLGTRRKDAAGEALMKKFSMPKKPTKKSPGRRVLPSDAPEEFDKYHDYNETDIVAEAEAAARIPDLSPKELELWKVDQAINRRGVQVDRAAVQNCIAIVNAAHEKYNRELYQLTGGTVARASELAKLKVWLSTKGLHVESLDADGIEEEVSGLRKAIKTGAFVPRPPGVPVDPKHVRYTMVTDPAGCLRALEIREAIGSAAVKKLFSLNNQMTTAGRVHDLFSYHGARTGRPTGSGPQPTNFPNSGPELLLCACRKHHGTHCSVCPWCGVPVPPGKKGVEWNPEAVEDVLSVIATRSLAMVESMFGDAMSVVSGCLRGLFIAAEGCDIISSDYSAIEAVGLAMLAGEQWRIDVFRTHGKIYEAGAAAISKIPFNDFMKHAGYTDEQLAKPEWWKLKPANPGKHHPLRKTVGKVSELASGYGGWIGAWKAFGADEYFTDDEIKGNIIAWRNASPFIVDLWGGQHRGLPWEKNYAAELFGVEGAAVLAIQNPGQECFVKLRSPTATGRLISYLMKDDILYCKLPSGRFLTYHRPRLTPSTRRENEVSISYEGYNTNPKGGMPKGWVRMDTYGPKLVENINQAATRDIHTHAMVNLERAGYPIVLHVYDEVACEVPKSFGSVEEVERIMGITEEWARDWPVRAAGGWRAPRYRK